jgi:hypothetical protein
VILIGRVERFARFNRLPLLFAHGRYGRMSDHHPALAVPGPVRADEAVARREFMLTWLRRARDRLSAAFEVHRVAVGLTLNHARVLIFLAEHRDASIEAIARECLLGPVDAEETLAAAVTQQDVFITPAGRYAISEKGRVRQNDLVARAAAFEKEQLAHLSPSDVEATARVLKSLASGIGPKVASTSYPSSGETTVAKEHG